MYWVLLDRLPSKSQKLIRNYDAFEELLLVLISRSVHTKVLINCLELVKELMSDNWKNILIMKRLGLVEHLMGMVVRVAGLAEVVSARPSSQ